MNVPHTRLPAWRRYNLNCDGVLSDDELTELCIDMDHPVDPQRLTLGRMLLDINGDGRLSRDEFSMWWKEGEKRWAVFEMTDEHAARVVGLWHFFEAFGPEHGALAGEKLGRLHLVLKVHGHTSKTLHRFLDDVDPEWTQGDDITQMKLTLYALNKWYFRESEERAPPALPTWIEMRMPIADEAREDYLVEEANRHRDKKQMLERAGRKLAYLDE